MTQSLIFLGLDKHIFHISATMIFIIIASHMLIPIFNIIPQLLIMHINFDSIQHI